MIWQRKTFGAFVGGHFLNREAREERQEKPLKIFAGFPEEHRDDVRSWRLISQR